MIEFGKTLKAARQAKGYTIGQIAESTRLMSSMVEDLENENFSRIAAPIYGRGFVKLYCEAVGLDPKPLVAEFMEIYSGNRTVGIKERPGVPPPPAPVATPEPPPAPVAAPEPPPAPVAAPEPVVVPGPVAAPEPPPAPVVAPEPPPAPVVTPAPAVPEPPRAQAQTSLFDFNPEPVVAPAPEPQVAPEHQAAPEPPPAPEPPLETEQRSLSRYASPLDEKYKQVSARDSISFRIPPAFWRLGALALATLAVLCLLIFGVRALYRATTSSPERTPAAKVQPPLEAPAVPAAEKAPPAKAMPAKGSTAKSLPPPVTSRQPQAIPPLYID